MYRFIAVPYVFAHWEEGLDGGGVELALGAAACREEGRVERRGHSLTLLVTCLLSLPPPSGSTGHW